MATIKKIKDHDYEITVNYEIKEFKFFGKTTYKQKIYRGDANTWYNYPSGKRCYFSEENSLGDIWEKEKFKERGYRDFVKQ